MRSCCMKFKAHVLNQVKVLYVSKLITAPQPELRLGLFNVPAAIVVSPLWKEGSWQNKVQSPGSNNNHKKPVKCPVEKI